MVTVKDLCVQVNGEYQGTKAKHQWGGVNGEMTTGFGRLMVGGIWTRAVSLEWWKEMLV